jgi:DNA topoisomerase-3
MVTRTWLTEKPSVAKALAEYFGVDKRFPGYYVLKNGDIVTHAIGHLVEQAEPDAYLPEALKGKFFAKEAIPYLMVEDSKWIKRPKSERDEKGRVKLSRSGDPIPMPQLAIVTKLLKEAKVIVNAGDIDREGQYLADELIEWAGIKPDGSQKPIERVLITSLDDKSLRRVIDAPRRSNGEPEFVQGRYAGECRAKADWMIGMAGSRSYSISAKTVVPVGRVRTPVTRLVVNRTMQIQKFVKQDYYVPIITLESGHELIWQSRKEGGSMHGIDANGRIIDKQVAEAILKNILAAQVATKITRATIEEKKQPPPLPFSGSALGSAVGKKHGMTAKQVAKAAQGLYEKHKAISYIGTDARHVPESQHADSTDILKNIAPILAGLTAKADLSKVSGCWNSQKLIDQGSAHHAIIPTGNVPAKSALTGDEAKVYDAICRRYLSQFYPDYRYNSIQIEAEAGLDVFKSSATETIDPGWHVSEGSKPEESADDGESNEKRNAVRMRQ